MLRLIPIVLACASIARAGDPLDAVSFLEGEWQGRGKHPYGPYDETQTIARALGGTVIEVRTKSTMGQQTVHEDLRVISWDPAAKALRMRQWAKGWLRVYTGAAGDDGTFVFTETAREGAEKDRWRYTFTPSKAGGFSYRVDTDAGEGWKPFVSGALGAELKDPGQGGGLGLREFETEIDGMRAQVHHPDGEGPFPAIVFSPGGDANTFQGYRPYGRFWATWGFVTVIVAFDDADASARAPKFGTVLDWLEKEATRDGSPLKGMVDPKRLAVAGHSRGGDAALRAARRDKRVKACLALAPSGPEEAPEGNHQAVSCLIIGDGDDLLPAAKKAYGHAAAEKFLLVVPGLDHMLAPREATLKLVARATAFLNYALKGDARYRAHVVGDEGGVDVTENAAAEAAR